MVMVMTGEVSLDLGDKNGKQEVDSKGKGVIRFEDTFHKILFVHCVRYSTRIKSQLDLRYE